MKSAPTGLAADFACGARPARRAFKLDVGRRGTPRPRRGRRNVAGTSETRRVFARRAVPTSEASRDGVSRETKDAAARDEPRRDAPRRVADETRGTSETRRTRGTSETRRTRGTRPKPLRGRTAVAGGARGAAPAPKRPRCSEPQPDANPWAAALDAAPGARPADRRHVVAAARHLQQAALRAARGVLKAGDFLFADPATAEVPRRAEILPVGLGVAFGLQEETTNSPTRQESAATVLVRPRSGRRPQVHAKNFEAAASALARVVTKTSRCL